ncbi:MAG: ferredoxin family protein [Phycisphaerae bacterium]|nr:ferredoxin family protein [Phycisphaerae bacterium]
MAESPDILICRCAHYHRIPEAVCDRIVQGLREAGASYEVVDDLCGLATNTGMLEPWARRDRLAVVACYPRAVRWLFHRAGVTLQMDRVRIFNGVTEAAEVIVSALTGDGFVRGEPLHAERQGEWVPWFPVIDYDRCVDCKQCLNFCLFGVYGLSDEGRVEVVNPQGCKTNCPACARVCPERAIIFPKYEKSPINGDEVNENAPEEDRSELEALLGGEVHDIIRERTARKRFARKADGADALSSQQKRDRLSRLQEELDIPQDVLDALSGPAKQKDKAKGAKDCPNAEFCEGDCQKREDDE